MAFYVPGSVLYGLGTALDVSDESELRSIGITQDSECTVYFYEEL